MFEKLFVEPCDLGEHLKVAEVLSAEGGAAVDHVLLRLMSVIEFAEARIAVDHAAGIGHEEIAQDEGAFFVGEGFGGFQGDVEERVIGLAARVLFHLHHHGGHQVEGLLDLREFLEDFDHAVVVFEGVHAGPREAVFARGQVLVEGLVHVPEEAEVDSRHGLLRSCGGG